MGHALYISLLKFFVLGKIFVQVRTRGPSKDANVQLFLNATSLFGAARSAVQAIARANVLGLHSVGSEYLQKLYRKHSVAHTMGAFAYEAST